MSQSFTKLYAHLIFRGRVCRARRWCHRWWHGVYRRTRHTLLPLTCKRTGFAACNGWWVHLGRGTDRSRGATRLRPAIDLTVRAVLHSLLGTESERVDSQKPRIIRMQRGRVRCTTDIHVRRNPFLNRCIAQRQSLPHGPRTKHVRMCLLLDEAPTDMDVRRTGARASVSPRLCPAATHVGDTWLAVTS